MIKIIELICFREKYLSGYSRHHFCLLKACGDSCEAAKERQFKEIKLYFGRVKGI